VREISIKGLMRIRYSENIMNTSIINETIISISVRKAPGEERNISILSWNVTKVQNKEHEIQLEFAKPEDISNGIVKIIHF